MIIQINKENVKVEGNNLIIEITEEIKAKLGIGRKQLKECNVGDVITDNIGVEWIVIKHDDDGTKVWRKNLLPETYRFDPKQNNFAVSEIERMLNTEYIKMAEEGFGAENILKQDVDLTSLDGLDTYGVYRYKVRLGGLNEYRYARKNGIFKTKEDIGGAFWLDTPNTTTEGYFSSCVQFVCSGGRVDYSGCGWGDRGVRPFLNLSSDIFVSVKA